MIREIEEAERKKEKELLTAMGMETSSLFNENNEQERQDLLHDQRQRADSIREERSEDDQDDQNDQDNDQGSRKDKED